MRSGRYLKPAGQTTAPTTLVSVIATTEATGAERGSHTQTGRLRRVFVRSARYRRGAWSRAEDRTFEHGLAFHAWLEAFAEARRVTHIVSPVASNALTLTGFWSLITDKGAGWRGNQPGCPDRSNSATPPAPYQFTRRITHGKPDIITYGVNGRTLTWVSGCQYFACGEPELERVFDFAPDAPDLPGAIPGTTTRTGAERARLWLTAMQQLADWWRRVKGGPWGLTIGQMAERFFMSRLEPRTICLHDDDDAKRLEGRALWGGRASVWYYGDVFTPEQNVHPRTPPPPRSEYPPEDGPLELWDVRSMYPTLLGRELYPVKLLTHKATYSPKDLSELVRYYGVIASVRLKTATPEYPYRYAGRVLYPTGDFDTVICGPELELALAAGDVAKVYQASTYQLGRPFTRTADELLSHRAEARAAGRIGWELMVKTLSNSLPGKLAQRTGRWVPKPSIPPPEPWASWVDYDAATGTLTRLRSTAGMVEGYEDCPERRKSTAACFAYLTSYGRTMMRSIRESLGWRTVVAMDTDGIWTRGTSLESLPAAFRSATDAPGRLRVAKRAGMGRWWDARHYWTDDGWTLAGFHDAIRVGAGLRFTDTYTKNPMEGRPTAPPLTVTECRRTVVLSSLPVDGRVGPSGWQEPLHFPTRR